MGSALFADISHFQPPVAWPAYKAWAKAGDGVDRIVFKATEGTSYTDPSFEANWKGAIDAGISLIGVYHFARPDLSAHAADEARYFAEVVGHRLRPGDRLMLDFEAHEDHNWAHGFYDALQAALHFQGKLVLYDAASRFNQFFAADLALAEKYDAALAAWHPLTQGPPAAPRGWQMAWWQFSDREPVPGIGPCDANLNLAWNPATPPTVPPPPPTPDIAKAKQLLQEALQALG